jgi:hypothetical protein
MTFTQFHILGVIDVQEQFLFIGFFLLFETESCYIAQAGLELMTFLPWPPEYRDDRHASPHLPVFWLLKKVFINI